MKTNHVLLFTVSLIFSTVVYGDNCKDRFEIKFIPFEIMPYTPFTEQSLNNGGRCSFKVEHCKLSNLFTDQTFKETTIPIEPRIKITDTKTGKNVFISRTLILKRDNKYFELSEDIKLNILPPIIKFGTECSAKNKYESICKKSSELKKSALCIKLKTGKWPKEFTSD